MIKRNLLVMGLAVLLSACGFQLRGTGTNEIALKELGLSARNSYGSTVVQLREALANNGVTVTNTAPYKLVLADEKEERRAATYTRSSRSAEYELSTTLEYTINGHDNTPLVTDKLEVRRYYVSDGNNYTAGDQGAAQLRQEIRRELVQAMLVRLQYVNPAHLDELQRKADERAKAEAQAQQEAQRIQDETPQQSPLEVPAK